MANQHSGWERLNSAETWKDPLADVWRCAVAFFPAWLNLGFIFIYQPCGCQFPIPKFAARAPFPSKLFFISVFPADCTDRDKNNTFPTYGFIEFCWRIEKLWIIGGRIGHLRRSIQPVLTVTFWIRTSVLCWQGRGRSRVSFDGVISTDPAGVSWQCWLNSAKTPWTAKRKGEAFRIRRRQRIILGPSAISSQGWTTKL